ncbi:MAG: diaminopimelate decarboxylase [Brachymonas sp.]|jgi:diaminopimelate decarboxylase
MSTIPSLPGAPFLHYSGGQLHLEGVRLADLAAQHGTPLFAYSKASILAALAAYQKGLAGRKALICYALKANSHLAILQVLAKAGCGFDTVSKGEIMRALKAGAAPEKIVFSGVGKTRAEMHYALEVGIHCFNVESIAELHVLSEVAAGMGKTAPISIRVNPNVDAKTHPYISTGLKANKFGIAHEEVLATYQLAAKLPGIAVKGIDCHIGSQITQIAPYLEAVDKVLDLVDGIEQTGIKLEHIDFGGGLGIQYKDETPPAADALWGEILARCDARGYGERGFALEPGRSLVGNAGVCLTEVQYLKQGEEKNFCIVDAAMNDLPRPAMYEAYHHILPLQEQGAVAAATYDVVGPVCESGDWLGRERSLAVQAGDVLAVCSAGAYCMSMASNYNTRGRAVEVLIDGTAVHIIRQRESYEAQMAGEILL